MNESLSCSELSPNDSHATWKRTSEISCRLKDQKGSQYFIFIYFPLAFKEEEE